MLEGSIEQQVVDLQDHKRDMVNEVVYNIGKGKHRKSHADLTSIMKGMQKQMNQNQQRPRQFGSLSDKWRGNDWDSFSDSESD